MIGNLKILRLHSLLVAAGIPIHGVSGTQGSIRIDFMDSATAQQRDDAAVIVAGFDWSDAAQTLWEHQQIKTQAAASIDNGATSTADQRERIERCIVDIIRLEFNRHTDVEKAMFDAVEAATSLADLKTRYAAITQVPQRSLADLVAAIKTAIAATPE